VSLNENLAAAFFIAASKEDHTLDSKQRIDQGTSAGDQKISMNVVRRRKYHIATARWQTKCLPFLHIAFLGLGILVILLPAMYRSWRSIIESVPLLHWIFLTFSNFEAPAISLMYFMMFLGLLVMFTRRDHPEERGQSEAHAGFLGFAYVSGEKHYPRTRKEEFAFYAESLFETVLTTSWIYVPSAALANMIIQARG
jgi:hypothetical protein